MKIFFGKQENIQSQSSCLLVVPSSRSLLAGGLLLVAGPGRARVLGPATRPGVRARTRRTRGAGGTRAARTAAATVRTRAAACLMTTRPLGTKCTSKLF